MDGTSQASAPAQPPASTAAMPKAGRAALRAGVVGNWIDNVHMFLPLTALAPAMAVLAGPGAAAATGAIVVIAMMLGRPLGGVIFGRISDKLGRTRTTKIAITGTALCALLIAVMPTYELLGGGTIAAILALRFIGGIFIAGEYSAAIPLAMEWSSPRKRGFMSGLILSMAPWAQASIAFAVAWLLALMGPDAYAAWGWRILFVIGALLSVGMLIYYRSRVTDAPIFHRERSATARPKASVKDVVLGRWSRSFWQAFIIMTGLFFLTQTTVVMMTAELGEETGLTSGEVSVAMGIASINQAIFMILAGHISTRIGRRNLFIIWGTVALIAGPGIWWAASESTTLAQAALCASLLQVATVAAYGPISAYLSERFPTEVRSTGYGIVYSWSLIIPSLYPFYLPTLQEWFGPYAAIMGLIVVGAGLVILGAALGPALSRRDISRDLDEVASVVDGVPLDGGAPTGEGNDR